MFWIILHVSVSLYCYRPSNEIVEIASDPSFFDIVDSNSDLCRTATVILVLLLAVVVMFIMTVVMFYFVVNFT